MYVKHNNPFYMSERSLLTLYIKFTDRINHVHWPCTWVLSATTSYRRSRK